MRRTLPVTGASGSKCKTQMSSLPIEHSPDFGTPVPVPSINNCASGHLKWDKMLFWDLISLFLIFHSELWSHCPCLILLFPPTRLWTLSRLRCQCHILYLPFTGKVSCWPLTMLEPLDPFDGPSKLFYSRNGWMESFGIYQNLKPASWALV